MLIRPATAADAPAIDALLDTAFGPGRHARTAARLRAGAMPLDGPSLVAVDEAMTPGGLLGSIQFWPIRLVAAGTTFPLTLLGPLAVATPHIGIGRKLLAASLEIADDSGIDPILLIGDAPYYGPFGFTADAAAGWVLPGPVERERLLLRQQAAATLPAIAHVVAADSVLAARSARVTTDA